MPKRFKTVFMCKLVSQHSWGRLRNACIPLLSLHSSSMYTYKEQFYDIAYLYIDICVIRASICSTILTLNMASAILYCFVLELPGLLRLHGVWGLQGSWWRNDCCPFFPPPDRSQGPSVKKWKWLSTSPNAPWEEVRRHFSPWKQTKSKA